MIAILISQFIQLEVRLTQPKFVAEEAKGIGEMSNPTVRFLDGHR